MHESRPGTRDSPAPRKRSNLTISRAQHPQQYTQLPFTTTDLGEHALGHRTRLITSATTRPRSHLSPPRPPSAQAARTAASVYAEAAAPHTPFVGSSPQTSQESRRAHQNVSARLSSLDCLQPRLLARPHSANHRWVFLTQETLHPTFGSTTKKPAPPGLKDTCVGGGNVAKHHDNGTRVLSLTSTSASSSSGVGMITPAPVSLPLHDAEHARTHARPRAGRPPLATHARLHHEGSQSTDAVCARVELIEGDAGETALSEMPPHHLVDTLARAARQGGMLGLKTSSALPLMTGRVQTMPREGSHDEVCDPASHRSSLALLNNSNNNNNNNNGSAVVLFGDGVQEQISLHGNDRMLSKSDAHTQPPRPAAALVPSRVAPQPSAVERSDEARVAELWALSTLARPVSAGSVTSQRQACAANTGLLADGMRDPRGGSARESRTGPARGDSAVAEAHRAFCRVAQHLPAEQQSIMTQRLYTREQWCAQSLHDFLPIAIDDKEDAAVETRSPTEPMASANSTAAGTTITVTPPSLELRPPTWIPSRTSSVLSHKALAPTRPKSGGSESTSPALASLLPAPPLPSPPPRTTSELASLADTSDTSIVSDTATPGQYMPALAIQIPQLTAASSALDESVLAELPPSYAAVLVRAKHDQRAYEERNRSLVTQDTSEMCLANTNGMSHHREADEDTAGSPMRRDSANSVTLPPWLRPTTPLPLADTHRRVSLPFAPDDVVPGSDVAEENSKENVPDNTDALRVSGPSVASTPFPRIGSALSEPASAVSATPRPLSRGSARLSVRFAEPPSPSSVFMPTTDTSAEGVKEALPRRVSGSILSVRPSTSKMSTPTATSTPGALPSLTPLSGSGSGRLSVASQSSRPRSSLHKHVMRPGGILEGELDDATSEDSDAVAQRQRVADASVALYRQHLHEAITGEHVVDIADADAAVEGGRAGFDFVAQSRLGQLSARFVETLEDAAVVHHYDTPAERQRLIALADAFREQRLQQIVPRLHPTSAACVSDLDPRRQHQQRIRAKMDNEDVVTSARRAGHRGGSRPTSSHANPRHTRDDAAADATAGGVFPLTEAWRRADQRAMERDMFFLGLRRDDQSWKDPVEVARSVEEKVRRLSCASSESEAPRDGGRRRSSARRRAGSQRGSSVATATMAMSSPSERLNRFVGASYNQDPRVAALLATHESAVSQAQQLKEAMERSFRDMVFATEEDE